MALTKQPGHLSVAVGVSRPVVDPAPGRGTLGPISTRRRARARPPRAGWGRPHRRWGGRGVIGSEAQATASSRGKACVIPPSVAGPERLGHCQITLTLDAYSHVLPTLQKDAADKMDGLFRKQAW